MEFVFILTKYDDVLFKKQVSKALEKRTELVSRKQYPKMWKFIDKINSVKMPEEVLKKRRARYRIYGILFLLLGLFVLIPSLMKPKEMIIPLLLGIFSIGLGILYLKYERKSKKEKPTQFDKATIQLFDNYEKVPYGKIKVIFTDDKVQIVGNDATEHSENIIIEYSEIEKFFVTEDLFILIWNEKISVLQKKDLISCDVEEFLNFISINHKIYLK